jgi:DNA-binding MurR/RpiR family transcriptional regulator
MRDGPLAPLVRERFDTLPPTLQAAARFVLAHPEEVALLSTREQARRAGVSPAALTRLAQRLDLAGYEELRRLHAEAMRRPPSGLAGRAAELVAAGASADDTAFIAGFLQAMGEDLAALSDGEAARALARAADTLAAATRVKCLGLRSSFAVAYMAAYVMGLVGVRTDLVDAPGGAGVDRLRDLEPGDALLAITVRPYTRTVRQALGFARARGAAVVAVTDDPLSAIAREADVVVPVRIETPSFFHAMTPAFATVECLAALVARRRGASAPEAARRAEAHLDAFDVYEADARRR